MHIGSFAYVFVAICSSVLAQQTRAVLDAPVVFVDGWGRCDELVDLDLDGDLDGAGIFFNQVSSSGNPVYLQMKMHRNEGGGRFTSSVLYQWSTTAGTPTQYRSAVGDVDGDGHDDLVTLRGSELWVVESRPGQPVVRTVTNTILGFAYRTAARMADVDGDGREELITTDTSDGLRVFTIGTTTFGRRAAASTVQGSSELALLDADGNGTTDAAIVYGNTVVFYPLGPLGWLTPLGSIALPPGLSSFGSEAHLTAGDVDNDGDVDLVAFGLMGQYAVVERRPTGYFVRPIATGGPATDLYDFDGDGDLDGCCCGGGTGPTTTSPNADLGNFEIAENLGGGVFAPSWRMPSIGPFHLAGCADLDGDGRKDLVGGRCIYFGRGTKAPITQVTPPILGMPPEPGRLPADLDADGDPDVLDPTAGYRVNLGNGAFAAASPDLPAPPGGGIWTITASLDLDGDGDPDLIANPPGGAATHLLRNAGGGHFVDAGACTPAGTTMRGSAFHRADLDGDGDLDLVAVDGALASRLWSCQPNGTFAAGVEWADTRVLAAADFTGDGAIDLLAGHYSLPGSLTVFDVNLLVNDGSGAFSPRLLAHWLYAFERLGIVDYEGDGDLDWVAFDYNGQSRLAFWLNDGTGQFVMGPLVPSVTLYPGGRIEVADVDRDGRWDVVAGPAGYPDAHLPDLACVWVVRQVAPGQFDPVLYSTQFGWPIDLDGDGDLDLLGRDSVRNTTWDGAAAGRREQVGAGLAGTGGAVPTLGATGPFRTGSVLTTRVRGGRGGELAVLLASFARLDPPITPLPGLTIHLDAPVTVGFLLLAGAPGEAGAGSAARSFALPPIAAGLGFWQQAVLLDPAGVAPGLTYTGALYIQVGW